MAIGNDSVALERHISKQEQRERELLLTLGDTAEALKYIRGCAAGFPVHEPDDERFMRIEQLADECIRSLATWA